MKIKLVLLFLFSCGSPAVHATYVVRTSTWVPGTEIPHFFGVHHHGATGGAGDWYPDYASIANYEVTQSGNWSQIFAGAALGAGDVVLISTGVHVVYDLAGAAPIKAIAIKGGFELSSAMSTRLNVGTIQLYGTGTFTARQTNPALTAEVVFTGALDPAEDPETFSHGFFSFGGTVRIEGAGGRAPFSKLSAPVPAGATAIQVRDAAGWRAGDSLLLADTQKGVDVSNWAYAKGDRTLDQQFERRTIAGVSGNTVTLDAPLSFDHDGWLGNETRNVVFRSDLDGGSPRAHMLFGGHVSVEVRNALLYDMGRTQALQKTQVKRDAGGNILPVTVLDKAGAGCAGSGCLSFALAPQPAPNQMARYAMHLHHPHEAFLLEGNVLTGRVTTRAATGRYDGGKTVRVLNGTGKWGIVNHQGFGAVRGNLVVGPQGAGIVGEDGNETGVVEDNLVIGTGGGVDTNSYDNLDTYFYWPGLPQVTAAERTIAHVENEGQGYWFKGPFAAVRRNVAAGYFRSAGFEFWYKGQTHLIPDVSRQTPYGIPDDGLAGATVSNQSGAFIFEDNVAEVLARTTLMLTYVRDLTVRNFTGINIGGGEGVTMRAGVITFIGLNVQGSGVSTGLSAHQDGAGFELIDSVIANFATPYEATKLLNMVNTVITPGPIPADTLSPAKPGGFRIR